MAPKIARPTDGRQPELRASTRSRWDVLRSLDKTALPDVQDFVQVAHDFWVAARRETARARQMAAGIATYARNPTAQETAKRNKRIVERAVRDGLGKKETAREYGLNVKTVRKYWPSDR